MTRPIVLSNGSMHAGVNLYGMVHDFYYPYVGLENHAVANNMRWRIGVWTEGKFSWLDDGRWQFTINYEPDALISNISTHNAELGVIIELQECIDANSNALIRNVHIINEFDRPREIRLFLHQVLRISNSLNGDTAQYLPDDNAILHYKGNRHFMFGAVTRDNKPFDQFATGVYGIEGKDGAYRDAEDGELSGNAVEHGSVDSVIGFNLQLEAHGSTRVTYWAAAGRDTNEARLVFNRVKNAGIYERIIKTAQHWRHWLKPAYEFIDHVQPEARDSFIKSLLIIKSHIDRHGAVIASTDTTMRNYARDAYAYCWPRDGALALWPLLRLGYHEEIKNFFYFCRRILQPQGYLMHKYQADGALGSSWHPYAIAGRVVPPIQEDETAVVIFLLGQYYQATDDKATLEEFYDSLIRPAASFMASYIDEATKLPHATYDIWEEKFLTTTYTTAITYAALHAAASMAQVMERQQDAVAWQAVADDIRIAAKAQLFNHDKNFFYKGFLCKKDEKGTCNFMYDDTIDVSSFYGAFMFGLFDLEGEEVTKSYKTLQNLFHLQPNIVTPLPRYENDNYNRNADSGLGNPWFVTTLWLAQYYIETNQVDQAERYLEWVRQQMLVSGVLSEQANTKTNAFISVAPLIWSQAEYINTIIDLHASPAKQTKDTQND